MNKFLDFLTGETKGSNSLSFWLRKKIEKLPFRQILGVNLASLAFFSVVVLPQADSVVSDLKVISEKNVTVVQAVPTEGTFQWPMTNFGISQGFSSVHPAVDMPAPLGTPVYPVADGWVVWTNSIPFGYGNHVLLAHDNNINSLYAHLSKIEVKAGQTVTKKTEIGQIGASGWATGNHLHFELFQNGSNINPFEVLPDLSIIQK